MSHFIADLYCRTALVQFYLHLGIRCKTWNDSKVFSNTTSIFCDKSLSYTTYMCTKLSFLIIKQGVRNRTPMLKASSVFSLSNNREFTLKCFVGSFFVFDGVNFEAMCEFRAGTSIESNWQCNKSLDIMIFLANQNKAYDLKVCC